MLERILYQSRATNDFSSLHLFNLLTDAQHRNERLEITGHLLYLRGGFTQCIEGPTEHVEQLWQSILRDPRHHQIEVLVRRSIERRNFPEWSMAFSTYSSFYVHGMRGFFPIKAGQASPLTQVCTADLELFANPEA